MLPAMKHTITAGGTQFACESMGAGPGVLFLHAGVADRRSWALVQDSIASEFQSHAYDRRGFGETRCTEEPHSHVNDLLAIQDALDPQPTILVGNSQGGRIAIDFALAHPDRVQALVLVAPAVSGAPSESTIPAATAKLAAQIESADEAGDLDRVNELEAHFWLDGSESESGRVGELARSLFLEMNGRALVADPVGEEVEAPSAMERMGQLAMPVHLMLGGRDLEQITRRGHWIAEQVQEGSVTLFEGAAHLPQMEDPSAFSQELLGFLRGLPPR